MRKKQYILLLLSVCLLEPGITQAQESNRKWSLRYTADLFDKPFMTYNPEKISTGNGHSAFAYMGEYYLTDKWTFVFTTRQRNVSFLEYGLKDYISVYVYL